MVDLRKLTYFQAVAEERSFTRAARRVYVTQPTLTHQIHRLEETLGAPLFIRSTRRVELTPEGERLLELCRAHLQPLQDGLRDLRSAHAAPVLRVGYPDYAGPTPLPAMMRVLQTQRPGLQLDQVEGSTLEQVRGLLDGQLDVGFFVAERLDAQQLPSRVLWAEPLGLAMPENHHLAALTEVPLAALHGEPVIMNSRESSPYMHAFLTDLFATAGIHPLYVVSSGARLYSFAGVMRLVAEEVGVFPIVRALTGLHYPGVTVRSFAAPVPTVPFRMAWRPNLPVALLAGLHAAADAVTRG